MKAVTITRTETSESGTFGILKIDGGACFHTCELPWRNNAKSASCIPHGVYKCRIVTRPSGEKAYEIKDVPGRSAVLIHSGNTIKDIQGCVLLGRNRGVKNGIPAVLDSRAAVADFMAAMGGEPFDLEISGIA